MRHSPHAIIGHQKFLVRKWDQIEDKFYLIVDQFVYKISHSRLSYLKPQLPDFTLNEFSFISDWQKGDMSSEEICERFKHIDYKDAAKAKLIKKINNFMFLNEDASDECKQVIAEIEEKCIPHMIKYLDLLNRYFVKLAEIDKQQIKITWLEQNISTSSPTTTVIDLPLNQAIKQIDRFILKNVKERFYFDKNIVVLDEALGNERLIHWIFAPESYIEILKKHLNITIPMSGEEEVGYLKFILKGVS